MQIRFNHIALLVPSVEKAAAACRDLLLPTEPMESFPKEGTREIYVGDRATHGGLLLLIEAAGAGPYERALKKRGPGLHHIAVDVTDLDAFTAGLSGTGWVLHPESAKTIAASRTAWLMRPGFPGLIEVQERENISTKPPLVTHIKIPALLPEHVQMLMAIGLTQISPAPDGVLTLILQDAALPFGVLL